MWVATGIFGGVAGAGTAGAGAIVVGVPIFGGVSGDVLGSGVPGVTAAGGTWLTLTIRRPFAGSLLIAA
jgi:hypothetical protein